MPYSAGIVRHTTVLALGTAALAAFGIGLALRPLTHGKRSPAEVEQVRTELVSHYYRRLPKSVLDETTVTGVLGALHDRYTTYLSPSRYRLARRSLAGDYGGIGGPRPPAPAGPPLRRTVAGPAPAPGGSPPA